jgi:predicted nucleic acid-binding protein
MTYLVDANVLSEPTKPAPSGKVIDWLSANGLKGTHLFRILCASPFSL